LTGHCRSFRSGDLLFKRPHRRIDRSLRQLRLRSGDFHQRRLASIFHRVPVLLPARHTLGHLNKEAADVPDFTGHALEYQTEITAFPGKPVLGKVETTCWPHKEWGVSGGTVLVASPPAIVARWLAGGRIRQAGVLPPEQVVDAAPFFKDLEARGARTTVAVAEPFPA